MSANLFSSSLLLLLLLTSIIVHSQPLSKRNSPTPRYKRLAKYCYIDNYQEWLRRQEEFLIWLNLAKILRLPLDNDENFQREFQQYRLQQQCLRLVERLPISIGPG